MNNIQTILITGGTGKVGSQLVKHFLKNDVNIVFLSKTQEEVDFFITTINKTQNILGFAIDLVDKNSILKILSFLEKKQAIPNYLINCARNLDNLKTDTNGITQRKEWINELTLDVIIPYELSMALAKQSNSKLEGIINISSMYGVVPPNPNLYKNPELESPIQYGVAKAAQIHLTKELAIRLAPKNIKVNAISFGGIEGRVDKEFKKKYAKLCPLERMLKEDEVIGAVDFLISKHSTYITGHNLIVDGGWSVW